MLDAQNQGHGEAFLELLKGHLRSFISAYFLGFSPKVAHLRGCTFKQHEKYSSYSSRLTILHTGV